MFISQPLAVDFSPLQGFQLFVWPMQRASRWWPMYLQGPGQLPDQCMAQGGAADTQAASTALRSEPALSSVRQGECMFRPAALVAVGRTPLQILQECRMNCSWGKHLPHIADSIKPKGQVTKRSRDGFLNITGCANSASECAWLKFYPGILLPLVFIVATNYASCQGMLPLLFI